MAKATAKIGELLDIPADALYGAESIHMTGGSRVYVENHRGIYDYSPEFLCFDTRGGLYEIRGSELIIELMSRDTLLVSGDIRSIVRSADHVKKT